MTTFVSRISSPRAVRRLSWLSALFAATALVVFAVAYFGDTAPKAEISAASGEPAPTKTAPAVPLDKRARQVAGEFVVSAVTRQNVKRAWALTHPELRSAVSERQWLNGELPVPFFPAKAIDAASFKVDESRPRDVTLDLLIIPKKGSGYTAQAFLVTLRAVGQGTATRWLVSSFTPHGGRAFSVQAGAQ